MLIIVTPILTLEFSSNNLLNLKIKFQRFVLKLDRREKIQRSNKNGGDLTAGDSPRCEEGRRDGIARRSEERRK